jgi:hypothetical protein
MRVTATGSLHRSEVGMSFNVRLERGGVTVGNRIDIAIEVEGVRRKPGGE